MHDVEAGDIVVSIKKVVRAAGLESRDELRMLERKSADRFLWHSAKRTIRCARRRHDPGREREQ